jgi:hypothetical protein
MGYLLRGKSDQTSEAFAYIRREYNDVKGRVEFQRDVVAQLHMVEAEAGEAEAALNALLVLGLLAKVARRQVGRNAAVHSLLTSIGWRVAIGAKRDHNAKLSALAACCEGSESIITLFAGRNDLHLHEDFRLD